MNDEKAAPQPSSETHAARVPDGFITHRSSFIVLNIVHRSKRRP
jgi:hypothetical protein